MEQSENMHRVSSSPPPPPLPHKQAVCPSWGSWGLQQCDRVSVRLLPVTGPPCVTSLRCGGFRLLLINPVTAEAARAGSSTACLSKYIHLNDIEQYLYCAIKGIIIKYILLTI